MRLSTHLRVPCPPFRSLLGVSVLAAATVQAQVPTQCFEIESILVDACNTGCPGATEGENEMVRFITGPAPIALSDLAVQWPNNNNAFRGLVQDATTAGLVATLNSTIESCGYLLEPASGIIPPGSRVLLITSTDMCTAANSFTTLSDTLYVIFQNAGNTGGHFANQNNGATISPTPTGGSDTRTLIMTYVPTGCADTVTYDRQELPNVFGTYGGSGAENDGATAVFSWPGVPTVSYRNFGCQAPFVPITVAITSGGGNVQCGSTTSLVGEVGGDPVEVFWSGGQGTFSDDHALSTDYTLGSADAGTVTLTLNAVSTCGDTTRASVDLIVTGTTAPTITPDGPTDLCTGGSVQLTASGGGSYVWSTTETTDAITVSTAGTYTVTSTTACGQASASITITMQGGPPQVEISGDTVVCAGGSTVLTASGGTSYLWNGTTPGASFTVNAPGPVTVQTTNACGSSTATVTVEVVAPTAAIAVTPTTGAAPLQVSFQGQAVPSATTWVWDFGDDNGATGQNTGHTFDTPGEYTVTLATTGNGCSALAQVTILVVEEVPSTVLVPNVFSPNNDGKNDVFKITSTGLATLYITIFDRWGHEVARISRVDQGWSGRNDSGEPVSDGTYFYVLKASGADGRSYDLHGTITVLR